MNNFSNFGTGYDDSAGAFAGGNNQQQFGNMQMNQQQDVDGGTPPGSQNLPKTQGDVQTITPVTIRQLLHAKVAPNDDDCFKVDNFELTQITLIGLILSKDEVETQTNYVIDDGTGKICVSDWSGDDKTTPVSSWREGMYVRVYGHLKSFGGARSVVTFRMKPIIDYNEITYHLLQSVHCHLYRINGPLKNENESNNNNNNNNNMLNNNNQYGNTNTNWSNASSSSSFSTNQQQQQQQGFFNQQNNQQNNIYQPQQQQQQQQQQLPQANSNMQQAVLNVIKSCPEQAGAHWNWIIQQLQTVAPVQIKQTIDFLTSEGHLYSTIDDKHWKSAEQ